MILPVNGLTYDEEKDEMNVNLSPDALNGDWIRASRLNKNSRKYKKLERTKTFVVTDDHVFER